MQTQHNNNPKNKKKKTLTKKHAMQSVFYFVLDTVQYIIFARW